MQLTSLCSPFSTFDDQACEGELSVMDHPSSPQEIESLHALAAGEARLRARAQEETTRELAGKNWSQGDMQAGLISFEELADFRDRHALLAKQILRDGLRQLGVPWTYLFQIDRDQHGRLHVTGGLPERFRNRLEQALDINEDFLHSFHAAATTTCIMESSIQSRDFYRAYEEDQAEALERFSWLIGARWDCRIDYDEGDITFSVFRVD